MKRLAATALLLLSTAPPAAAAINARLQGTFAMRGVVTVAVDVLGEHAGDRIARTWTFTPSCSVGVCHAITLERNRSLKNLPDTLVLDRTQPGVYVGQGRFPVPLLCAGQRKPHGGVAIQKITVRITRVQTVGTTPYATAVSASYRNPKRINKTRCPGGIGHDAATYTGQLASPLPTG